MKAITTGSFSKSGGRGIHLNAFPDGQYRITPTLKVTWAPGGVVVLFGYRTIEPKSASVILKKNNHIQSVEFEVVQRRHSNYRRI
jgi:hypothetical protein